MKKEQQLSQKTILVVGGTSGIGLEIARDVVARGDRVILTGRDEANAKQVAASLGEAASGIAVDISEPESIAGQRYYTIDGPLKLERDSQSNLNTPWGRGEA